MADCWWLGDLPLAIPRTSAKSFVSGDLALLAVFEFFEPVLDDVDRCLRGLSGLLG